MVRISAQLIEADSGREAWAQRYDRSLEDIFAIQDDITEKIVTELDVRLLEGEQARRWRRATHSREAYELWAQGWYLQRGPTREGTAKAKELAEKALEIDPNYTLAMVELGWANCDQGDAGWSDDATHSYNEALAWGKKAVDIDPSMAEAHVLLANVLLTLERHREGVAEAEKALSVSPNNAGVLLLAAWVLAPNGRADEAVELAKRGMRLDPFPRAQDYGALGDSFLFAKRVDEALPVHRQCVEQTPDFIWCQLGLTVDYVLVGKESQAKAQVKEALRINPGITAANNTYVRSIGDAVQRQDVVAALRQAGLK